MVNNNTNRSSTSSTSSDEDMNTIIGIDIEAGVEVTASGKYKWQSLYLASGMPLKPKMSDRSVALIQKSWKRVLVGRKSRRASTHASSATKRSSTDINDKSVAATAEIVTASSSPTRPTSSMTNITNADIARPRGLKNRQAKRASTRLSSSTSSAGTSSPRKSALEAFFDAYYRILLETAPIAKDHF